MRNVGIISVGYNGRFVSKRPDISMPELVQESVESALKKTRLKLQDIDAFVEGNMPTFEGVNYPHLWMSDHMGAVNKPVLRISTGGTTGMSAFHGAYYSVASGLYDTVMVVGWEKHDEGDAQVGLAGIVFPEIFTLFSFGPPMAGPGAGGVTGGGSTGGASFQATSYLAGCGGDVEHIDMIAAQARSNAALNPFAHLQHPGCTKEDIAKTPLVSWPLRFGHTCPTSCGACAMILTTEEKAKKYADSVAWVTAVGTGSTDATTANLVDGQINDPGEQPMCRKIAKKAYEMAGIEDPQKEIQVAEVYDGFAFQELMWPERLGLIPEGKGPEMLEKGALAIDGEMPINPSGGVVSTNAIGASALVRVAEAAMQVMGTVEGDHQVPRKVHNALAHGWGGLFQFVTITLLGDQPRHG